MGLLLLYWGSTATYHSKQLPTTERDGGGCATAAANQFSDCDENDDRSKENKFNKLYI